MPRPGPRLQVLAAILFLTISTYLIASYPSPTFRQEQGYTYHTHPHADQGLKRVAIIGAGASGSSAAWFLARAGRVMSERMGREVLGEITVFESDTRVGGSE
jgi:prenylcysteine oxidase/farnesylcysteine lyase